MAPFMLQKINVTHGWLLWRLLKSSQIALVQASQANAVFIPELENRGFNGWIWCMCFQQATCILGVHPQYKVQGLLECFSPIWRLNWKAEGGWWWNPFSRLGGVKRAVRSVTCLQAGHVVEQSLVYVFACTNFQEFWLLSCGECSLLIFFSLQTQ